MSFDPIANILESNDQSRQVVSSNVPLKTRSMTKELYSLGARNTKTLQPLHAAKCFPSGLNFTQLTLALNLYLCTIVCEIKLIR